MTREHAKLSRREREIMDILYRLGSATAAEVGEGLADPPSYSAVRALLAKLEKKGHIRHEERGPRYVYSPVLAKDAAQDSAMSRLVQTFFGGSVSAAVTGLLGRSADAMSDEELEQLSGMIERARRERGTS
ncbi:MAG: BlaI/MecI/CopY family transcriptional regulator [Acidobacteriota bacterium]